MCLLFNIPGTTNAIRFSVLISPSGITVHVGWLASTIDVVHGRLEDNSTESACSTVSGYIGMFHTTINWIINILGRRCGLTLRAPSLHHYPTKVMSTLASSFGLLLPCPFLVALQNNVLIKVVNKRCDPFHLVWPLLPPSPSSIQSNSKRSCLFSPPIYLFMHPGMFQQSSNVPALGQLPATNGTCVHLGCVVWVCVCVGQPSAHSLLFVSGVVRWRYVGTSKL